MSKRIRFEVHDRYMLGTCCTNIYLSSTPTTIVVPSVVGYMLP